MNECSECQRLTEGITKVNNEGVRLRRDNDCLRDLLRKLVKLLDILIQAADNTDNVEWESPITIEEVIKQMKTLKAKTEAKLGGKEVSDE